MEKESNITGTCIPNMHYMVDISNKLKGRKTYFKVRGERKKYNRSLLLII